MNRQKGTVGMVILWWAVLILSVRALLFVVPVILQGLTKGLAMDPAVFVTGVFALVGTALGLKQVGLCRTGGGTAKKTSWQSILVVDDDETVRATARSVLIHQGYSVLTAENGEEGLAVAERQRPDVILLDVILPGIKGREVCRRLKENPSTKDIPVIFLTAKESPDDIQAEKEVGGQAHLTKPIDTKTLIATIEGVLSHPRVS